MVCGHASDIIVVELTSHQPESLSMVEANDSNHLSGLPVPNSTSSFWHSEPNEFLLDHHTTPKLPAEADVVIVGSGITGSSAARFLSEDPRCNGRSMVMPEAREACWGATGRNGGTYR